jgi:hypothetical protein
MSKELDYFIKNQAELVKAHAGKVLVIVGDEIVGVFDEALPAYLFAKSKYAFGTFVIQPCVPGPDAYTVFISSTHIVPTPA